MRAVNIRLYKPATESDIKGLENWRVDPKIAGGGYFVDLACHMIDLLQFLIGPIISAQGHVSNQAGYYSAEDVVSASFQFEDNIQASGIWCFNTNIDFEQTEILGSDGQIIYSNFMEAPVILRKNGKEEIFNIDHPEHIQQPLIQRIVDELLGKGISPSRGTTAAKTNWVMDQLLSK